MERKRKKKEREKYIQYEISKADFYKLNNKIERIPLLFFVVKKKNQETK